MATEWETVEYITKPLANNLKPHPKLPFSPIQNKSQTNPGPPNTIPAPPQIEQQPKPTPPQTKQPNIIPINALNIYNPVWTIKARVTAKSNMRTFANDTKIGKLFSVDFIDKDNNEIRAIAFNEVADKWFDQVEIGYVYLVSKANVKQVQNKRFSPIRCDYEITLTMNSIVELVENDKNIKNGLFELVALEQLAKCARDIIVDVLGIAKDVSCCEPFVLRNQRSTFRRTLRLVDKTSMVDLTIWGILAHTNINENDIIIVKNVRVSDFSSTTLLTSFQSSIVFEPEDDAVLYLRAWFHNQDPDRITLNVRNLTIRRWATGETIMSIKEKYSNMNKKYIHVKATIVNIKAMCYEACPRPDCYCRKVIFDCTRERFYCRRCYESYTADDVDYRYILDLCIADYTGSMWVRTFSATEGIIMIENRMMHELQISNNDEYQRVINAATFRQFDFMLKSEVNEYNGATSTRFTVQRAYEIDSFAKEMKRAFARVAAYGYTK